MPDLIPFPFFNTGLSNLRKGFFSDDFFKPYFDSFGNFKVDVKDNGNHYLMEAELPGVERDNIDIRIENGTLTISANEKQEKREEKEGYILTERRTGHMQRSFSLDNVDEDGITADYKDGILSLKLPKKEGKARQPKKIDIH